ncbi:hypothetical protein CCUS01_04893 [Colletotrichum cuscutae]|uniref:Uncharacterized protein n=1 Tax=Colletotrichum cuscutae TaxID=1209917 RepID=A0AAI9VD39_9PEZI|nr:hypothetical protein CCUS01_04893 [Colletotrichum cuscutae]
MSSTTLLLFLLVIALPSLATVRHQASLSRTTSPNMQPITLANRILLVSAPLALANPIGEAASAIFVRQINCWKANCGGAGECAGSWRLKYRTVAPPEW